MVKCRASDLDTIVNAKTRDEWTRISLVVDVRRSS